MAVFGYMFQALKGEVQQQLADQQKELIAYAETMKLEIDDFIVEDTCSMKSSFLERKQGAELSGRLQTGDCIIVSRVGWVLGSIKQAIWLIKKLKEKKISLFCADLDENITLPKKRKLVVSEGGAELIFKLLTELASCDSSLHGEKIKAAKLQQKKEGRYLGGPVPFGWRVNDQRVLEKDDSQQPIIDEIARLRRERWSYRDISRKLLDDFGIRLSHEGVRKVFERSKSDDKEVAQSLGKEVSVKGKMVLEKHMT